MGMTREHLDQDFVEKSQDLRNGTLDLSDELPIPNRSSPTTRKVAHGSEQTGEVVNSIPVEGITIPHQFFKTLGPADLIDGDSQETVSSASLPRESIETWLQETTSVPSRKRKRSDSAVITPSPPPHISESFLDLEEIEFKMPSPKTPKNQKTNKSKTTKISADAHWIKQRLEQYDMYQGDDEAFDKYPRFKDMVHEILGGERHSEVKEGSKKRFKEKRDYLKSANESTFLDNLIPMMIKEKREIRIEYHSTGDSGGQSSQELLDLEDNPSKWVVEEFWDSGCIREANVNFRNNFLPLDEELIAMMDKDKDRERVMTNPRPDYAFGLNCTGSKPPKDTKFSAETQWIREIVPYMYDCMLVIEGKSDRGEAAEAENQACRSGAALVNAARMMRERIGEVDVEGCDDRTFLFSGTLCPDHMELWVHWAEVTYKDAVRKVEKATPQGVEMVDEQYRKKHVDFHMNLLQSESLRTKNFLDMYRPFLHCILDWGCITRFNTNLKDHYERIYAWEKQQVEEAQRAAAEAASKSSDSSKTGGKRQRTK